MNIDDLEHYIAEIEVRVERLEAFKPKGTPGTGACICMRSPEGAEAECKRMTTTWETESKGRYPIVAYLDHRCALHGEKAQPALWGRNKDKELAVSYAQWASLGVTYKEPQACP